MSRKDNKYAIAKRNTLVKGLGSRISDERTVLLGTLVKIDHLDTSGDAAVRFLDKNCSQWEEPTYSCPWKDLEPVSESIWSLLLAVPSNITRADIAQAGNVLHEQIVALKVGCYVQVLHNKIFYNAMIRYIGPVNGMGPGSAFGLELLVRSQSQVTSYDGSYAGTRYFNALPGTGLFVTLDKLKPVLTSLSTANARYEADYPIGGTVDHEVELADIVGNMWPPLQQTQPRVQRNKSLNIVSHLISGRKTVKPKVETFVSHVNPPPVKEAEPISESGLTVGTLVEVVTDVSEPLCGVLRWLGGETGSSLAGVELEEDHEDLPLELTDGTHNGVRRFTCSGRRALFVPLAQCRKDQRFAVLDDAPKPGLKENQAGPSSPTGTFGQVDSPIVRGAVPPLCMPTDEDVLAVCGKFRGIQGHHNSCYLDATLFAMFTYTSVFDSVLFRPRAPTDIAQYEEVQRVLREEIVNPLRRNLYVRADRVIHG